MLLIAFELIDRDQVSLGGVARQSREGDTNDYDFSKFDFQLC